MTANARRIAFIGFGEVGQTFAADFLRQPDLTVAACDILADAPEGTAMRARAEALGVALTPDAEAAAAGAHIIISAVTASQAEAVAQAAARYLQPGQMFVDVNSAAPTTKQRAAAHVEGCGARYIEAAVMAPVLKPRLAVPILTGGPHAGDAAALLNPLGMNMTAVADVFGRASAMKLCRSIIIKGLEALMVDCAAACEQWNVKDQVFPTLAETFPALDWYALADNMRERVATHGVRRAAEMREAGEMLAALGMSPALANAVADAQARGARPKAGA